MKTRSVVHARFGRLLTGVILLGAVAFGRADAAPDPRFEQLKSLAGNWVGKAGFGEPNEPTTVSYRVTAGGTAVIEVQFEGTTHEMTTVYHMDGENLMLTHYCAAGNQPRMRALPSDNPAVLRFDFLDGTSMKPLDGHMHAAMIKFDGPDHLLATWYHYDKGKPAAEAKFDLTRVKE